MYNTHPHIPGHARNVDFPPDDVIADFLINEIQARRNESNMYDYAYNLLSEHGFKNELVDDLIDRPKLLLQYIADHPDGTPPEIRFDNALGAYIGIGAFRTVEHDKAFVTDLQRNERHILMPIAQEEKDIQDLLIANGYIENNSHNRPPEKIGGYTPRGQQTQTPVNKVRTGRESKAKPKPRQVEETRYEPRIKSTPPQRPLLRKKDTYVQNGKMAYADHSTFNRLALTEVDIPAKPNFFAGVENPDNILDDSGYSYAAVEDVSATCHSQAVAIAWANSLSVKSELSKTNTIVDITYETVQVVDMWASHATRELALMNLGPGAKVLEGNLSTFGSLVDAMLQLKESAQTSSMADVLLRTVNRRATIAVNKMLRFDLAVESQYITDFITDWYALYNYLVEKFTEKAVVTELSKYERTVVSNILNITAPNVDEVEDISETTYSSDMLTRSIITSDRHFTCVLPISAGKLGFALDERTSYVCHAETPEEYNYLLAIIKRAEVHASLHTYESISVTTIDNVRFNIKLTEVQNTKTRVATKPYLAITFVDYQ